MAPSPELRIGQLAGMTAVNPKTIRYYESIGLLPEPVRSVSGYRLYSGSDAERLQFIRRAKGLGFSLSEIRDILAVRATGMLPCDCVQELAGRRIADLDRRIAELEWMREDLAYLALSASEYSSDSAADVLEICPAIESDAPAVIA